MRPLFIGGCDRSGTTLLASMLGAHRSVVAVPEAQFVVDASRTATPRAGRHGNDLALQRIQRHWRFRIWDLSFASDSVPSDVRSGSYASLIAWLVGQYAHGVGKSKALWWVDHTPWNVRFALTLFELFPEARLVHMVRDGRAVAASVRTLDWGPCTVIRAAPWWAEKVAHGLAAEAYHGPQRVLRLHFEDLVAQPEASLRKVCAFSGIDYSPEMTLAEGFRKPRYTATQHSLVGTPPDPARSAAWRSILTDREVELFELLTGDFLPHLGYMPHSGSAPRPPRTSERLRYAMSEVLRGRLLGRLRLACRRARLIRS